MRRCVETCADKSGISGTTWNLTNFPGGPAVSNDGLGKSARGTLAFRASDVKNVQGVQVVRLKNDRDVKGALKSAILLTVYPILPRYSTISGIVRSGFRVPDARIASRVDAFDCKELRLSIASLYDLVDIFLAPSTFALHPNEIWFDDRENRIKPRLILLSWI
jgi:hypothetical protein